MLVRERTSTAAVLVLPRAAATLDAPLPFLQRIPNPLAVHNPVWLGRSGLAAYGLRTANGLPVAKLDNLKIRPGIPLVEFSNREQQPAKPLPLQMRNLVHARLVVNRLHRRPIPLRSLLNHEKIGVTLALIHSPPSRPNHTPAFEGSCDWLPEPSRARACEVQNNVCVPPGRTVARGSIPRGGDRHRHRTPGWPLISPLERVES
jgi:hypothetical protein